MILTNGSETFAMAETIDEQDVTVRATDTRGNGYTRCDIQTCDHSQAPGWAVVWHDDENTETFWEEGQSKTGPIRVFGELIPDRILARAAEQVLLESTKHGDPSDCAGYILECAAHHVRYPDSTQSFQSVAWMDWRTVSDPLYKTLKALHEEAVVARTAAEYTPGWDYLERRCAKLAREIDEHVRGRVNALAEAS